ncbi:MAG TPA: dihydrolipoamide acyltransferase, partial [Saprospiraceae bacterium]|nr:dihydrolipoamide acyltransferase [Saprospiraceae bacterium]
MAQAVTMPRLSDTMEEGNIVRWLKNVGDKVSPGDALAEVETDKATMDLESFFEGYLLHIAIPEGPVAIGALLGVIGKEGEDISAILAGNIDSKTENKPSTPEAKSYSGIP